MSKKESAGMLTPLNQNESLHDWNLELGSLRLEIFTPRRRGYPDEDKTLLGFADDCGHIYPRERALILIERLLSFYRSITDKQIDEFNLEIEGLEGRKISLLISFNGTLFENRLAMGDVETKPGK